MDGYRSLVILLGPAICTLLVAELRFRLVKVEAGSGRWYDFASLAWKMLAILWLSGLFDSLVADYVHSQMGGQRPDDNWAYSFRLSFAVMLFILVRGILRARRRWQLGKAAPKEQKASYAWGMISAVTFCLLVVGCGIGIKSIARRTEDVREICRIPAGSSAAEIIPKALSLNFEKGKVSGAGIGIRVRSSSSGEVKVFSDDLQGIDSGSVTVGKVSLPPFMRNYCEISFVDRKVTETRTWTLD
ncbi:MAG TPA: hypothetical protein VIH99_07605 [Bdellovibrionota bacterium]|jgi:hypothetical protein